MTQDELNRVRNEIGWSISMLAARCGVGQIQIQKMLAGKRPIPEPIAHWLLWIAAVIRINPVPDDLRQPSHTGRGRATGEQRDYRAVPVPRKDVTNNSLKTDRPSQRQAIAAPAQPPLSQPLAAGRAPPPPPPAQPPDNVAAALVRIDLERAKMQQERAGRSPFW